MRFRRLQRCLLKFAYLRKDGRVTYWSPIQRTRLPGDACHHVMQRERMTASHAKAAEVRRAVQEHVTHDRGGITNSFALRAVSCLGAGLRAREIVRWERPRGWQPGPIGEEGKKTNGTCLARPTSAWIAAGLESFAQSGGLQDRVCGVPALDLHGHRDTPSRAVHIALPNLVTGLASRSGPRPPR